MKKLIKRILFIILLTLSIITLVVVPAFFRCDSDCISWITLIASCLSSFCTIFLGIMVYEQTEKSNKRAEEERRNYNEQEQMNRQQELRIKANPVVYLNGINRFDYYRMPCLICLGKAKNNLSNEKPQEKYNQFESYFSIDLLFSNPANRMIDNITIQEAVLKCFKGNFTDNDYDEKFEFRVYNYSEEKANIKVGKDGGCISLLQLFSTNIDEMSDIIRESIYNTNLTWVLSFKYTLSNSCNVATKMQSQITFNVDRPLEHNDCISCGIQKEDVVTWQRSDVFLEGEA